MGYAARPPDARLFLPGPAGVLEVYHRVPARAEGRCAENQGGLSWIGLRGQRVVNDRADRAGGPEHSALVSHPASRGNAGLRLHQDRRQRVLSAAGGQLKDAQPWRDVDEEREGFRLYRKFSADAVIKFDGQELPPLPDDKTKEQAPQPQPPK